MSLFHLFSKPKVERAHGYGERQPSGLEGSSPKGNTSTTKPDTDTLGRSTDGVSLRATSIFSFRKPRHNSNTRPYAPEFKQPPRERKLPHFDPPPLFQAYPQSVKDGVLEVSPFLDGSSRSKARYPPGSRLQDSNGVGLEDLEEEMASQDPRQSQIAGKKGVPGVPTGSLSKKMFVLVTSGYLLQYSNEGPSDRLPEKMLPLGRDSAAFASDLVPGKFYTLQVSEAIDQSGNPVPQSSSLFSKLGIRNANAKRITSNFVLIMQDAKEMETWMAAIRNQIELAGGRKFVTDATLRPQTSNDTENKPELRKTPSHRYLVKRDPNKVSNVSSPATTPLQEISGLSLPIPNADEGVSEPSRPQSSRSEAATIDGIEAEASRLVGDNLDSPPLPQVPSDLSISSSYGALKKSPSSSGLRLSTTPVRRASQLSSTEHDGATSSPLSAGAFLESPTSDNEAISDGSANTRKQSLRGSAPIRPRATEPPAFTRKHSMPNVRSALPPTMEVPELPRRGSLQTLSRAPRPTAVVIPPKNIVSISKERFDSSLESPTMGRHSAVPLSVNSGRVLATVRSEPNLPLAAVTAAKEKRDSKIPPPPSMVLYYERPESFLGDLPPPSTWSSSKPSSRRFSGYQATSPEGAATSSPPGQNAPSQSPPSLVVPPSILKQSSTAKQAHASDSSRPDGQRNSRRMSTFSMPLKINPSTAWNQNEPSLNNRRASQLSDPDAVNEAHQVYSLASKPDPPTVKRFSLSPSPTPSPIIDRFPFPARASTSQLSSIANQTLTISQLGAESPSELSQASPSPPSTATVHTAQALPLRRPISLHVRADHAPFLAGGRTSIGYATSGPGPTSQPATATSAIRPLQSLRTTRSASNMPLLASTVPPTSDTSHRHKASPPEAFNGLDFGTTDAAVSEDPQESTQEASLDQAVDSSAAPALARPYSPPVPRSTSRHSGSRTSVGAHRRTSKSRSSIDIGLMGLGPPAPPPLAPLPAPPPGAVARSESHRDVKRNSGRASRKGSRTGIPNIRNSNHQRDAIGLGLGGMESTSAVSPGERASPPPAMHGLGIQVG